MTRKAIPLKLLVDANSGYTNAELDLTMLGAHAPVLRLYSGKVEVAQLALSAEIQPAIGDPLASLKARGIDVSAVENPLGSADFSAFDDVAGEVETTDGDGSGFSTSGDEPIDLTVPEIIADETETDTPPEGSALFSSSDPPPPNPFDQQ